MVAPERSPTQERQPLAKQATAPQEHQQAQKAKPKLHSWSTKEESDQLAQELHRLGRPVEPMKWANDDIENKWLRREATYEMFRALLGPGSEQPQQECGASTTACEGCDGSTRNPTPDLPSARGHAFEHDALSNFVGQANHCPQH
jgi:hypothetical protein